MLKILLHTCCAPCFSYPFELLSRNYRVDAFYYNPNISPSAEYYKRLDEIAEYSKLMNFKLIESNFNQKDFYKLISPFRFTGEGGERCRLCYQIRMEKTAEYASDNNYDYFSTALSISPHKNSSWITEIGKELELKYNVKYYESDFKKNGGFKRSCEISKNNNFYRQNYCGCIYSLYERKKNSYWHKVFQNHLNKS